MAELKVEKQVEDPGFYDGYLRLPGLFRRCEFEQIVQLGEYRFEEAGRTDAGCPLIAVYRREVQPPSQEGGR